MSTWLPDDKLCLSDLTSKHVVVTAYAVQSSLLEKAWLRSHHTVPVNELPTFVHVNRWIEQCYQFSPIDLGDLLSVYQQRCVWHSVIRDSYLMQATDDELWSLAGQALLSYQQSDMTASSDTHHLPYLESYKRCLVNHGWLDHQQIETRFSDWYQPMSHEGSIVFAGFSGETGSLQHVMSVLATHQMCHCLSFKHKVKPNGLLYRQPLALESGLITQLLQESISNESIKVVVCHKPSKIFGYAQHVNRLACQVESNEVYPLLPERFVDRRLFVDFAYLVEYLVGEVSVEQLLLSQRWRELLQADANCLDVNMSGQITCLKELSSEFHACQTLAKETKLSFQGWQVWFSRLLNAIGWDQDCLCQSELLDWSLWHECLSQARPWLVSMNNEVSVLDWLVSVRRYGLNKVTRQRLAGYTVLTWQEAIDMPIDDLIQIDCQADVWPPIHHVCDYAMIAEFQVYRLGGLKSHRLLATATDEHGHSCEVSLCFKNEDWVEIDIDLSDSRVDDLVEAMHELPFLKQPLPSLTAGSGLLQSMADCPAKAFIAHRLLVKTQPTQPLFGLAKHQVGSLFHLLLADASSGHVIDFNWLKNQLRLQKNQGWNQLSHWQQQSLWSYLSDLHQAWVDYEKQSVTQPPLKIIHEQPLKFSCMGMDFRCRADRIDYHADGRCYIIDYKLGQVSHHDWLKQPMSSVQMPLYALALPESSGLLYAHCHPDALGFKGISSGQSPYPATQVNTLKDDNGDTLDWSAVKHQWLSSIQALIDKFNCGYFSPIPREGETTCQTCDFKSLCRYHG